MNITKLKLQAFSQLRAAWQEIYNAFLDSPPFVRWLVTKAWVLTRFVFLWGVFAARWVFWRTKQKITFRIQKLSPASRQRLSSTWRRLRYLFCFVPTPRESAWLAKVWKKICRFCFLILSPRERVFLAKVWQKIRSLVLKILRKFIDWVRSPTGQQAGRLLTACSGSFAAVATIFIFHALEGEWTWFQHLGRHFASQIAVEFLPIPIMFMLWLRYMDHRKKFVMAFSPLFCAISIVFFVTAQEMASDYNLQQELFVAGVISALFIMVPFSAALGRMLLNPRVTICAIVGSAAACNYYWLQSTMWEKMCGWTAQAAFKILHPYSPSFSTFITPHQHNFIIISPHFQIQINPGCNGLEGIFLFNFLLSAMLLIDWELFKRKSIVLLYAFGVVYMFYINALRIVSFFTLGFWAYNPYAWHWMWYLQSAPLILFHSYVGWVFYLIGFGVFAGWMYTSTTRETLVAKLMRYSIAIRRLLMGHFRKRQHFYRRVFSKIPKLSISRHNLALLLARFRRRRR